MAKAKKKQDIEFTAKLKGADNIDFKDWGKHKAKMKGGSESGGALYFVGAIGSLIYWMQAAAGFGAVITGILKSLVWPAYIVYQLLENFYGLV